MHSFSLGLGSVDQRIRLTGVTRALRPRYGGLSRCHPAHFGAPKSIDRALPSCSSRVQACAPNASRDSVHAISANINPDHSDHLPEHQHCRHPARLRTPGAPVTTVVRSAIRHEALLSASGANPNAALHVAMPHVFQFSQGSESRRFNPDSSPLLGRFRAVPPRPGLPRRRPSQLGLLSTHAGYGSVLQLGDDEGSENDEDLEDEMLAMEGVGRLGRWWRKGVRRVFDLWIEPRQGAVKRVVDAWWSRYGALILMPASLVSVYTWPTGAIRLWDVGRSNWGLESIGRGVVRGSVSTVSPPGRGS